MFGAVLNSSLTRVIPIGMALLALQQTLFVEMKPFGVIIQLRAGVRGVGRRRRRDRSAARSSASCSG